jgi:eukaryotic-like serine/threonine-protein kinase
MVDDRVVAAGAADAAAERTHCPRCGGSFPATYRACPHDGEPLLLGDDPLIGAVIGERYRIERFAGEGGIGRVYIAQHTRLARRYAIKVPSGRATADPHGRERFVREAHAASRLDHPNVVSVIDFGETDGGLIYLVMELADGETLADHLAYRGALPAGEALAMARQLAQGLAHAHGRGLIHRDLKPANVMIERADGRLRILDFGLALLAESSEGRITSRNTVVGTPHYMSPEHACGQEIDARADLFSLGIILYKALTGRMPFDANPIEVASLYVNERIPSLAARSPELAIDGEAEALCLALVAADRERRPRDASAVIARIDAILARLAAERGANADPDAVPPPDPDVPNDPPPTAPTRALRRRDR